MAFIIREAISRGDRESAFRLRYDVYVSEMGRRQPYADPVALTICEPSDDKGHIFVATDGDEVVGTVRINFRRDGPLECEDLYELKRFMPYYPDYVSMTTKLIVRRDFRHTGVAGRLAMAAFELGRSNGVRIDVIDCNPHLLRLYQSIGYRMYRHNIEHPDYGSVIPMVLLADDIAYLKEIRSPFACLAERHASDGGTRRLFEHEFPQYRDLRPQSVLSEDESWAQISSALGANPADVIKFLHGISTERARRLLAHFDTVDYQADEHIFRQEDNSAGMFCILVGQVEIVREGSHGPRVVGILSAGEVFGEMGFFAAVRRTASARTSSPAKVLVVSAEEFQKFSRRDADGAQQLLLNLLSIVIERFVEASDTRSTLWSMLEGASKERVRNGAVRQIDITDQ
jgi:CRP-like cAMP-binding protein/predicted GNAT family N-acyltransferase